MEKLKRKPLSVKPWLVPFTDLVADKFMRVCDLTTPGGDSGQSW